MSEEHKLTAKGYVLNPGHPNKKNSQSSLYSECKTPCVLYAANWEPNKVPEKEIANSRVYLLVILIACNLWVFTARTVDHCKWIVNVWTNVLSGPSKDVKCH